MSTATEGLRERIQTALSKAPQITCDLDTLLETSESLIFAREIRLFKLALNSGMEIEDFLNDVSLARWLPAILEYAEIESDRVERLRRIGKCLVRAKNNRVVRTHTLTYLATLTFLVLLLFIFICTNILPVFDKMFKEFGLQLPQITEAVLWVGSWVGPNAYTILLSIVASIVMWKLGNRITRRLSRDRILVPYWNRLAFGNSENLIGMSRFANALACLLRNGAPRHEAVMIAARASNNATCLRNAIRLSTELKSVPASQCRSARLFPPLLIEALGGHTSVASGPQMNLELMEVLSQIYSDRAVYRRELMSDFLLPISLVLIGLVVAIIVLSIFLPLASLVTSLS